MTQQSAEQAKTYRFFVDGKPFQCQKQRVTGAELRTMAGIDPDLRIFVGDHGPGHPDDQIINTTAVDLAKLGEAKFYTLARPSMDVY